MDKNVHGWDPASCPFGVGRSILFSGFGSYSPPGEASGAVTVEKCRSADSKCTKSQGPTMDIFVHGWPKMVQEAYFLSFGVGCLNSFFGVTFDGVPHRLTLQKQSLLELRSPEIIN